jgi:hypothetical protein
MPREPAERNWLEVRILNRLNDAGHAVALYDLRDLVPEKQETIVNLIFDMKGDGLLGIFELSGGGKMVDITASGKAALFDFLTAGRNTCG